MDRAIDFFPPATTSVATGHSSREPTSSHHGICHALTERAVSLAEKIRTVYSSYSEPVRVLKSSFSERKRRPLEKDPKPDVYGPVYGRAA